MAHCVDARCVEDCCKVGLLVHLPLVCSVTRVPTCKNNVQAPTDMSVQSG